MFLSDLSVRRPVLTTVFSLFIVLLGIISFANLPVREYPDIDSPVVTVTTVYDGANPRVIETEITDLIEEELTSVEGIRTVSSSSREEVSSIVIEFDLNRDLDLGAQDIRDKISRISARLPDEAEDPIVAKSDADAQPIMWIRVQSDKRNLIELAEYTEKEIKDVFQNVSGVSKVIFGGQRKRAIHVLLDPKKIAAQGMTVLDIENALRNNNIDLPSGQILSDQKEFSVNLSAKLKSVKDYQNLIVRSNVSGIANVRLRDLATVIEGAERDRSFVRFNGQQGFGLGVIRQPKSNTLLISDEINKRMEELNKRLPEDIHLEIGYDAGVFIRASLNDVYKTIALASLLVIIIIFLFLRNFRSTLIPALSIPISLIGVMSVILAMGYTVNLMTLLGLIIAVGIVVDDSIIVLENIYRYIEMGMDPKEAAKKGASEITGAVIATTLVLVAIFLPIAFLKGITGRLLSEFAFSIAVATIISSFVALTMVPMLCSKFLSKDLANRRSFLYDMLESSFKFFEDLYFASLNFIIKLRYFIVPAVLVGCALLSVFLFKNTPGDFIPKEDRGNFLTILETPRGSSLSYLDEQVRKIENRLLKVPEIDTIISVAAFGIDAPGQVTQGIVINKLVDWKERSRSVFAIAGPLFGEFLSMPDAFVIPIFPNSGPSGGFGSQPVQFVIKSNNLDLLVKASALISQKASSLPSIKFARSNLKLDKPELEVIVNRDKALQMGVPIRDISRTLEILFGGIDITEFNEEGENYKVIVQVPRSQRSKPNKLEEVAVRSKPNVGAPIEGRLIQLANLIHVKESVTAESINHYDRKKAFTIDASPNEGFTQGQGLQEIETLAKNVIKQLAKDGFDISDLEYDYAGTSKELKDSNAALYFGFMVALLFAYLFLAGQYESFIQPIIVMVTVPLAITGALIGIFILTRMPIITQLLIDSGGPQWLQYALPQFKNISINVYSQIGIIMLIGMASKNGIIMVDFINQLRAQGKDMIEAIVEASKLRLRPILMTAFSTILGILPIAIASGVGAQSRQSMGVAVVAGMIFASFLTLFLVPCAYAVIVSIFSLAKKNSQ